MAGQIKQMLDRIISERSKGNATIVITTKSKILLKGVNPDAFTVDSVDDPVMIEKVRKIGQDFGISI